MSGAASEPRAGGTSGPPATAGPARLGPDFAKLWLAAGVSNLGDGVYATALPLLATTLTRDPLQVSLVMFVEWLPWLLFSLFAGVLADRLDRRRAIWVVDTLRLLVVGTLAVAVLLDRASLPAVLLCGFLLGTGQPLVDIAAQALVPTLVSRDARRLDRANGRLQSTKMIATQFAGQPLGGVLFGLGAGIPFLVDAVSFGAGAVMVALIRRGGRATGAGGAAEAAGGASAPAGGGQARGSLRSEIAEGLRWLMGHRLLRTCALLLAAVNLLTTMCQATLVLFVQDDLHVGGTGYGLLLACLALGGGLGGAVAPRLGRALGEGWAILGGLMLLGGALIGIGVTEAPWVAGALLLASGVGAVVVNVLFGSLRQQLVPDWILGRAVSVMLLISFGAVPVGALLGGLAGGAIGLRAPFLIAGIVIPLLALAAGTVINRTVIEDARARAGHAADEDRPAAD